MALQASDNQVKVFLQDMSLLCCDSDQNYNTNPSQTYVF